MAIMTWSNAYSVGIPSMDDQHRQLIDLVNQLHEAMSQGKGNQALAVVLNSLITYTQSHFRAEERLMQEGGYPDLARHQAQHQELTRQVMEIQQKFCAGTCALSISVLDFLKKWLLEHIAREDRAYGTCLTAAGVC